MYLSRAEPVEGSKIMGAHSNTGCLIVKRMILNGSEGKKDQYFIGLCCPVASGGLHICVLLTSFQKNDIGWPQQPLQEEYQISVKNWIFDDPFHKKGLVLVIWVLGMIQPSG